MTVGELQAVLADLPDWAVVRMDTAEAGPEDNGIDIASLHYRAGVLVLDPDI